MKANAAVKSIIGVKHITQADLTTMLNMKNQSSISGVLNRDMKTSTLVKFLSVLNCELVIKDLSTGEEYGITE